MKEGVLMEIINKKIKKFWNIFSWNCRLNIAKSMEYRLDFCIGMVVNLLFSCAGPVFQYLIFAQVQGFYGWTLAELLLFQGILLFVTGMRTLLLGRVQAYVQRLVRRGGLDQLLLRPFSSIAMVVANGFSLDGISPVIAGAVISGVAMGRITLRISFPNLVLLVCSLAMAVLLFISVDILLACVCIRLINIGRLGEIFDSLSRFGQYPLEIFPKAMGYVFLSVIPFGIWVNIPCRILLDGIRIYMFVTFGFVLLLLCLSVACWNMCMRHYTSAGG